MQDVSQIAAVTFNYKAADLIQQSVKWFKRLYPGIRLMIIDDGSKDGSTEAVMELEAKHPLTQAVILKRNIGQGRCFHLATQTLGCRYMFAFDSDIVFRAGGFLEVFLEWMVRDHLYVIGWHHPCDRGNMIVNTSFALLDLDQYNLLPPYTHGPDPCVPNMEEALRRGMGVQIVDIDWWAYHIMSGTTSRLVHRHLDGRGDDLSRQQWDQCGPEPVDMGELIGMVRAQRVQAEAKTTWATSS